MRSIAARRASLVEMLAWLASWDEAEQAKNYLGEAAYAVLYELGLDAVHGGR